jgi:hypothetical protein
MNKGKSKKRKGDRAASNDSLALYVYCVGESAALRPLINADLPEAIEEGASIETVEAGDLAAVASAVSIAQYSEEALQARLADPAWTAVRAMRHEKVMEHFAARATVVPVRFATIYLSRKRVQEMVYERQQELAAIIERLRGREEWGINVCRDTAALMKEIASISPRLRDLGERADRSSPGEAYLLRKQIDAMKASEARAETSRVVAEIERGLAALSEGATRLRAAKDETGEQGEIVAKLAFLVSRDRFDDFREAAERLAREHRAGFRLEMTGPWPAYNFSSVVETE